MIFSNKMEKEYFMNIAVILAWLALMFMIICAYYYIYVIVNKVDAYFISC